MQITAARAIIEGLAKENRRVLSDWRALLLLRRATLAHPPRARRWRDMPDNLSDIQPILRGMVKRNEIRPLTRPGYLYEVIVPYARMSSVTEDEILMESDPYAALGYLSALAFHALTDALPKEIMALVPHEGRGDLLPPDTMPEDWESLALAPSRRPSRILGRPVEWIRLTTKHYFGAYLYRPRDYPVRVTTPERTLLDGLLHPERCGGFDTVLRAWARARDTLDLERLITYIDWFGVAVLRQRAGFILEELGLEHPVIAEWPARAKRGGSSKLLGSASYASTYSERWSLSINAPIAALREGTA